LPKEAKRYLFIFFFLFLLSSWIKQCIVCISLKLFVSLSLWLFFPSLSHGFIIPRYSQIPDILTLCMWSFLLFTHIVISSNYIFDIEFFAHNSFYFYEVVIFTVESWQSRSLNLQFIFVCLTSHA
jgi:hypothetical protein